jgi:Response regulators consisting of a CheY-like receiver domain and a winged-helix DNA-binding domain
MYKILIIEDDIVIRSELQTLLEKYGYKTMITEDFQNIVKFTCDVSPHLILLDINLPVYDGYHICREIRKHSKVPIIVVTSRDNDVDELMSMQLGADDFVTKPYNTQILLARISAILSRTYDTEKSAKLMLGELTLDIGKSTVIYHTTTTELTKNELKIFALLIKNKNIIISRDEIMNELWQSNEFVDDNTLTVNINRLRKKLDEIGVVDLLQTKRGQGYMLCD